VLERERERERERDAQVQVCYTRKAQIHIKEKNVKHKSVEKSNSDGLLPCSGVLAWRGAMKLAKLMGYISFLSLF